MGVAGWQAWMCWWMWKEGKISYPFPTWGPEAVSHVQQDLGSGWCVCVWQALCALWCVSASSHQNERRYEIINWMPAWVQFQQLWPSWVLSVQSVWPVAPTTCTGLWTGRHPRFHFAIIGFNSDRSAVSWWGSIWFYMCTRQTWWLCYKTTVSVYEFNKTGKKNSELPEN